LLLVRTSPLGAQRDGGPPAPRPVQITAIPGVIAADAAWTIAWQGPDNADGLVGAPDGSVLFAQEQPRRVSRLDEANRLSTYLEGTRGVGSIALDGQGRLWGVERTCTDPGGNAAACAEPTAVAIVAPARRVLADAFDGKPLGRLNDLVVDARGGAYFTVGGAFYVNAAGRVTSLGDGIRSNGVILSPDERTVYVTNGASVLAWDVRPDGSVANRRDFAMLASGSGDGMAIDAAGRVYVTAQQGGVQVFDTTGRHLGTIPTPRNAISVAFAGRDKRTLYIVGSGALAANGQEFAPPGGGRNNAKTIYRIPMLAQGFTGRAK
jgi:gluconolactonase